MVQHLENTLNSIDLMPEDTLDQIVDKYIEMNIAHPFLEGNGRSMRIWLDMILKRRLKKCVDWSLISKAEYMDAMVESPVDGSKLKEIISQALTGEIYSREVYMKGIDYSYYYEEN